MAPLLARPLPAGGTIGIVSPASPYNTYSDVLRGIACRPPLAAHAVVVSCYSAPGEA